MMFPFRKNRAARKRQRQHTSRELHRRAGRTLAFEPLETRELLTVVTLQDFGVSENTGEKPQSKVWEYAGQWWSVMPKSDGTWVWRLDGTSWTPTLRLTTNDAFHADVKATGDLAHVLLYNGANGTQLASIQYVGGPVGYQPWGLRPQVVGVPLASGVETATIDVDSTGRMWVAYDPGGSVAVRYSDGLYTSWSAPITVATGIKSDDIAVVTAMPTGTIGVLWSNQNTDRFGFRIHQDGADPLAWSAMEIAAPQSASSNMADDHLNVAVASDGTLFAAVKTSYDSSGRPAMALLVRRPDGQWEPMYGVDNGGTRPIVVLNEAARKLIVAFTTSNGGGDIVYRESSMDTIAFGPRQTLINGNINNVTSTKQNFTDNVVVMASSGSNVKSVLFSFDTIDLNQAPQVNAGSDHTVSFGAVVSLDGTVSDDGLPASPGTLTSSWSKVSGPGSVSFANASAVDTTATFSLAGTYVLRLSSSDSQRTATDDVMIVVTAPNDPEPQEPPQEEPPQEEPPQPPPSNDPVEIAFQNGLFPSLAYAGTIDTKLNSRSESTNYGNETVLDLDGGPDIALLLKWDISAVPANSIVESAAVELNVTNRSSDNYEVYALERAWDELAATWQQYAAGANWAAAGANGAGDHGAALLGALAPSSTGIYRISLNDAGVAAVQSWINDPSQNHGIILKDYAESDGVDVSSSEASSAALRPKLVLSYRPPVDTMPTNEAPTNEAPMVDAGPNRTITLGGAAALDGSVSDDGLPTSPGAVTTTWTKVSGPGTVTFDNSAAVDTSATFSIAGTYVLRLTANDGEAEAFDDMTVIVNPLIEPNLPPIVDAGPNLTIALVGSASLDGSVSDDGRPTSPGAVATTWTKVSGPGTVTFANSIAVDTTASFSAAGTYVLRLTATDGSLSAADDVTVTVEAPNVAPTVSAGTNLSTTVGQTLDLNGTASDDGLPNGTLSVLWTLTTGPSSVEFGDATSADTTVQFSVAGTYVLRLTASDGLLQSFDEITVTVTEPVVEPPSNLPPRKNRR